MKKHIIVATILLSLLAVGALLYHDTSKRAMHYKQKVSTLLAQMPEHGFEVEIHAQSDRQDRFTITLRNSDQAALFLKEQGLSIAKEVLEALEGLRLKSTITYHPSFNESLDLKMVALTLPRSIKKALQNDPALLQWLQDQFAKETILFEGGINLFGSAFYGKLADVNLAHPTKAFILLIKGAQTNATLKNDKLLSWRNAIELLHYKSYATESKIVRLHHNRFIYGEPLFSYGDKVTIDEATVAQAGEAMLFKEIIIESTSNKEAGSVNQTYIFKSKRVTVEKGGQKQRLEGVSLIFDLNNLNAAAFKLLHQHKEDSLKAKAALDLLLKEGFRLNLRKLAAQKVQTAPSEMVDGFYANATLQVKKGASLQALELFPLTGTEFINLEAKVVFSDALYAHLVSKPEIALMAMLIEPIDGNGTKVLEVRFKEGKLSVNGKNLY